MPRPSRTAKYIWRMAADPPLCGAGRTVQRILQCPLLRRGERCRCLFEVNEIIDDLTDAGAVLLERARQVLGDLDDAENAARGVDSLRGALRVAMPGAFGTREIIPCLPGFLMQHPQLRVELLISDRTDDLVAEGADMALRLGRLADSGFGARLLATASRFAVAAPAYLAQRGHPRTLADLSGHDCIVRPGFSGRRGWSFRRSGAVTSLAVEGRVKVQSVRIYGVTA